MYNTLVFLCRKSTFFLFFIIVGSLEHQLNSRARLNKLRKPISTIIIIISLSLFINRRQQRQNLSSIFSFHFYWTDFDKIRRIKVTFNRSFKLLIQIIIDFCDCCWYFLLLSFNISFFRFIFFISFPSMLFVFCVNWHNSTQSGIFPF